MSFRMCESSVLVSYITIISDFRVADLAVGNTAAV